MNSFMYSQGDYDEALEWPFLLKHRISVLDQSQAHYQDIVSRVWDPKVYNIRSCYLIGRWRLYLGLPDWRHRAYSLKNFQK